MVCAISPLRAGNRKKNGGAGGGAENGGVQSLKELKRVEVIRKCGVAGKMNFVLRPGQLLNLKLRLLLSCAAFFLLADTRNHDHTRKINVGYNSGNRQKDTVTVELEGAKRIRIRAEYVCIPGDPNKTPLNAHLLWRSMLSEEEERCTSTDHLEVGTIGASTVDSYASGNGNSASSVEAQPVVVEVPPPVKFHAPVDLYLWYLNVTNRQVDSVLQLCCV